MDEPRHFALTIAMVYRSMMWVGRREGRRNVTTRRACLGALLGALLVVTLTLPKAATAGDVVCEACICGANPFASACRSADPYSTDECDAVCGAGNGRPYTFPVVCTDFASTRCPTSERGYCVDGVNNDQYQNDLTDCADPPAPETRVARRRYPRSRPSPRRSLARYWLRAASAHSRDATVRREPSVSRDSRRRAFSRA